MFDYDKWQEIFSTIRKNKMRTALTVLGIFWGIFMIIILLGAGNSFRAGVMKNFGRWANNAGFLWGNKTTVSYHGFQPGRYVYFNNSDTKLLLSRVPEIQYLAPRNSLGMKQVNYEAKSGQFQILGDHPEYNKIEMHDLEGRFINKKDIDDYRKVAVIGMNVKKVLFGDEVNPIGKFININKVNFKVIGVLKPVRSEGNSEDRNRIHIPFSTFQRAFHYGDQVGWYAYCAGEGVDILATETKILELLKANNDINPLDEDAIGHFNLQEEYEEISGLFNGLEYFSWFVGLSTLFAGIIGVSNIMLIIVKERTKEIGIRKSLGATPVSIIALILQESVFLTLTGGYLALLSGLFLVEGIAAIMPEGGDMPFAAPTVDPQIALGALGILVIGGMIAGILPARKAASINPIEAIRTE